MTGLRSFNNSTYKKVLNLLDACHFRHREASVKRIRVIKFGVNDGGGNGTGCCGIEVRAAIAKLTKMIIRISRQMRSGPKR